jgi:hypothetical protein
MTVLLGAGSSVSLCAQQSPDLVTPPVNILLPNYNSVPVGPNAGTESGAYVARVGDPSAAWINPAGLSRGASAELSGSSGTFQLATVSPAVLPNSGGSIQNIPSLVGFTVPELFGGRGTLGVAVLTANEWVQGTDSQIIRNGPDGQERFAYSADAQYESIVAAASLGYVTGRWRLGGGLALIETNLERNAVVSDRVATDTSLVSLLIASRGSGTAIQVRPLLGMQYDVSPHVLLGAAVRTPAISLYKSGSYTAEAAADSGAASQGVSFFDPSAPFDYRFPFEIHAGAAYVSPRGEIELDVHGFTPIGAYTLLSSTQPIVTYAQAGNGTGPVIGTEPFTGLTSQSRGIVNVAVGGHVALTSAGVWRIHFGARTDLSPVSPQDQVFTRVDMYGGTLGLSGTKGALVFTVGVDYHAGSSNNVMLRHLSAADATPTTIRVSTLGLIYSLAYKF